MDWLGGKVSRVGLCGSGLREIDLSVEESGVRKKKEEKAFNDPYFHV